MKDAEECRERIHQEQEERKRMMEERSVDYLQDLIDSMNTKEKKVIEHEKPDV